METVTNDTLNKWLSDLNTLSDSTLDVLVKVVYTIAKNKQSIETAPKPFNETRQKIVMKYSNGSGMIQAKDDPDNFQKAMLDLNEISNEETSIDIKRVSIEDFGDIKIPLKVMTAIDFMLK